MDPVSKGSRLTRIRRQRSQEWQNYGSSSDDEKKIYSRKGESINSTSTNEVSPAFLSLHRGASSSSDSEDSDVKITQNMFHESPPEPAPTLSCRTVDGLGRRPRLGYLESECESEPPYLPTMLSASLYPSQGNAEPNLNNSQELRKTSLMNDNEQIYSQPQQVELPEESKNFTNHPNNTSSGGPTYSNPLPVYCSTPSSTTGPMVPIANCVNPQLIQQPTVPGPPPFTSPSKFTNRFHFQKTCAQKCSWKLATLVLILLTTLLVVSVAYFAASSSINDHASKPCIVVEGQETIDTSPISSTPKQKICEQYKQCWILKLAL